MPAAAGIPAISGAMSESRSSRSTRPEYSPRGKTSTSCAPSSRSLIKVARLIEIGTARAPDERDAASPSGTRHASTSAAERNPNCNRGEPSGNQHPTSKPDPGHGAESAHDNERERAADHGRDRRRARQPSGGPIHRHAASIARSCAIDGAPSRPDSVSYTRHAYPAGGDVPAKRSSPSMRIVGEPRKPTRSASSGEPTSINRTVLGSTPAEARRARTTPTFGQPSKHCTVISIEQS